MITVTVVGNNPDRERIAGLILTAMLGGRYTVQRFREGTAPPDSGIQSDVRILEQLPPSPVTG